MQGYESKGPPSGRKDALKRSGESKIKLVEVGKNVCKNMYRICICTLNYM
jgi:hypothetical protein